LWNLQKGLSIITTATFTSWLQAYVSDFTLFSKCFEFTFAVNSTFLLMFGKLAFSQRLFRFGFLLIIEVR